MEQINEKTTQNALKELKYPVLVHKCWFHRVNQILKDRKIIGKNFVSLSDGIPLIPGHGDSAIVLNKEKLIKRGIKLLKIEYTKEFLNNHTDILTYVLENKSETEIREYLENYFNKVIEIFKIHNTDKIKKLENIRVKALKDPTKYFLEMVKYEDEVITNSPLEFDIDDVEKIIISSKTFERYSPLPVEFENKVLYIEDYYPITYNKESPLNGWLKKRLQNKILYRSLDFLNKDVVTLQQFVFALILHPEWESECYVTPHFKSLQILPKKLDILFQKIDALETNDIEELVNFVFLSYILYETGNPIYEDKIIKELNKKLNII